MTPQEMANLHSIAFATERSWSAAEFESLCKKEHVQVFQEPGGFALVQIAADEAELLTLAVAPEARRTGIADALMRAWMHKVNAQMAFLEVATDNHAAVSLYRKHGFATVGCRNGYYSRGNYPSVDALLMQAALPRRPGNLSTGSGPKTG